MTREPNIQRDGFITLVGGMDCGNAPSLLKDDQAAYLGNITVRGGYARTRPGWQKVRLTYADSEIEDWINLHSFQGGSFYEPIIGEPYAIISVGGRIFRVMLEGAVTEITPFYSSPLTDPFITPPVGLTEVAKVSNGTLANVGYIARTNTGKYRVESISGNWVTIRNLDDQAGILLAAGIPISFMDPNPTVNQQAWFLQAERWMFIQDGRSGCIIWDGTQSVRSDPTKEMIPTGTAMAHYGAIGRVAVVINEREIALSDLQSEVSDVRFFKEEHNIAGGGRFRVPEMFGKVRAMINIANLDTTLGQGSLLIGATRGIMALNLTPERTQWKTLNALQTTAMINFGPLSQNSMINVNGDVFYRAQDGIRSFIMARRDFNTWGNTAISDEMGWILEDDDTNLLRYSSSILFSNWVLTTCSPRPRNPYGWYHPGIAVLDISPITTMAAKSPPVWDGLWTGLNVLQLLKVTVDDADRAFAFCTQSDTLELWELKPDSAFDGDGGRPICVTETRAFKSKNEMELKRLSAAELWWDDVVGEVEITLQYRPDSYPCWFDWGTKTICAKAKECQEYGVCLGSTTYEPGYKTRIGFRSPSPVCETMDGKMSDLGYTFECKITWEGHARLKKMLLKLETVREDVTPNE